MITEELQKKIDRAIRLLQAIKPKDNEPIEVAYSGGKDSDVILQLAKEAGINYKAIYKNTTIDPPGTIKHAKEMGAEIKMPKDGMTFFKLIEKAGIPNMLRRHCCNFLKEYKILDKVIIGVRKAESTKRAARYKEPTKCRIYNKNDKVEQIMPILEWTDDDVKEFIEDRKLQLHHLYYPNGHLDVSMRLGCLACPMASSKKRISQFKQYPNLVKAYVRAAREYIHTHTHNRR